MRQFLVPIVNPTTCLAFTVVLIHSLATPFALRIVFPKFFQKKLVEAAFCVVVSHVRYSELAHLGHCGNISTVYNDRIQGTTVNLSVKGAEKYNKNAGVAA